MKQNDPLTQAVHAHAAAVLRLVDLTRSGEAVQWDVPPGARTASAHGVKDDPTGTAAVDARRLRLRAGVTSALLALDEATAALSAAADAIDAALAPWDDPVEVAA